MAADAQWSLFSLKSSLFGLGQTNWADKFLGICRIFGQNISTHNFPVELKGAVGEPLLYAVYGVWEESMFNIFSNTFSLLQLETKKHFLPFKIICLPYSTPLSF